MNITKHIVILVISLWVVNLQSALGQFKTVTFSNTDPIKKEHIKIQQHFSRDASSRFKGKLEYNKTLQASSLISMKNGLRPGSIYRKGLPVYIEGKTVHSGRKGSTPEALAYEYLEAAAPFMKQTDTNRNFIIKKVEKDNLGMYHVRLQQHAGGIPVYGAEIIIHGTDQGMDFLNGQYYRFDLSQPLEPELHVERALDMVSGDMGKKPQYMNDLSLIGDMTPKSALVLYPFKDTFYLAYHITTFKNVVERWEYFVNANSGTILHKFKSICSFHYHTHEGQTTCSHHIESEYPPLDGKATANAIDLLNVSRQINTYQVGSRFYLIDGSRDIFSSSATDLPNNPKGVIWTIDALGKSPFADNFNYDNITSSNNTWTNKNAVSSHFNGGKSFEYFRNVHNRKSINGNGGSIISMINVTEENGSSMANAYWNGKAIFYGSGDSNFHPFARSLDVAGHEMSHGVVEETANLEYQDEPGALNESFADIFGAMIDRDDWKIGEDLLKTNFFPSGAMRDMENPHNGASTNDFGRGWQPRHYNERFTGTADNGGVHINSGIPNFAFFKFATAVGKDKAEKVYYRALSNYLTKSSQFVDCRIAVVKAAGDLFGTAEVNAAKKAFDEVGITGEQGGDYEDDAPVNTGQEFLLTTGEDFNGLFIHDKEGKQLAQISSKNIKSKPSITDDGSVVVFVADDHKLYFTSINWAQGTFNADQSLDNNPVWRVVAISKDGNRLAGLFEEKSNEIFVFDFVSQQQEIFELYNPTYTQGIATGDVNFADAMEFDISGEFIMYDAENEIKSASLGSINYWDIGFIRVWDNDNEQFSDGEIEKLYSSLPEGVSVGNPTFSKNSPYIISFDYLDEDDEILLIAANIETGDANVIFENNVLSFPSYSVKDNAIVFDNDGGFATNVGLLPLKSNKIEGASNPFLFLEEKRWAIWFSNGTRVLSGLDQISPDMPEVWLLQNPVSDCLQLITDKTVRQIQYVEVTDLSGRKIVAIQSLALSDNQEDIPVGQLTSGVYILKMIVDGKPASIRFLKE